MHFFCVLCFIFSSFMCLSLLSWKLGCLLRGLFSAPTQFDTVWRWRFNIWKCCLHCSSHDRNWQVGGVGRLTVVQSQSGRTWFHFEWCHKSLLVCPTLRLKDRITSAVQDIGVNIQGPNLFICPIMGFFLHLCSFCNKISRFIEWSTWKGEDVESWGSEVR